MAKASDKVAIKSEQGESRQRSTPAPSETHHPIMALRHEIDHLFDDFLTGFRRFPFGRRASEVEPFRPFGTKFGMTMPAVDVTEKETGYEISVELPGLDEKDIEVALSDDTLTVKGEKKEETEEKKKDYYLSERRYGAFQRSFQVPAGTDAGKIDAHFKKGVLTINMPKTREARTKVKKIAVTGG